MTDIGDTALALWIARLRRRSLLSGEEEETLLSLPGVVREYASGRDIVRLGDRTSESCLIAEGCAARFGQNAAGARQISALYLPGDMGDLHSAVLSRVSAPLQSGSYATIYAVPHEALISAAEKSPNLARAFWRDCVVDAQITSEWVLNLSRRNAISRVSHLICEIADRIAAQGGDRLNFSLNLTQIQFADCVGLTAVHVNRTFRDLRRLGVLTVVGRSAKILDWKQLSDIADFDPAYLHFDEIKQ